MADDHDLPDWAARLASRMTSDGLVAEQSNRALRQGLNDLNRRLRYVLGEYDEPEGPTPVP